MEKEERDKPEDFVMKNKVSELLVK